MKPRYVTRVSGQLGLPDLSSGAVLFGKYKVDRVLGSGGMGVVVAAEHLALRSLVALKFLRPELAELPDAPERFAREARNARRIEDPHVARVVDVVMAKDALPYIEMEYLEGEDLGRVVKAGVRLSSHDAIDYVVQAASALTRAHNLGIVHRDVKPSNLFLVKRAGEPPLVKVLDFGISKVVEEEKDREMELTKTSSIVGSALYMSLEQMRSAKEVDHRTDIYALGVTIYELLTGAHPFEGRNLPELCVRVSLEDPAPIARHRDDVPPALAAAIAKAYARYPDDRYPTAGTFVSALRPFASIATTALIDAIQKYERESSQSSAPMVRRLTPLSMKAVRPEEAASVPLGKPSDPGWRKPSDPSLPAQRPSDPGNAPKPSDPGVGRKPSDPGVPKPSDPGPIGRESKPEDSAPSHRLLAIVTALGLAGAIVLWFVLSPNGGAGSGTKGAVSVTEPKTALDAGALDAASGVVVDAGVADAAPSVIDPPLAMDGGSDAGALGAGALDAGKPVKPPIPPECARGALFYASPTGIRLPCPRR